MGNNARFIFEKALYLHPINIKLKVIDNNNMRIRLFAIIVLVLSGCSFMFAQSGNVKDIRQTYLWDVTLSMQGKAKMNNGTNTPDIWNEVKRAIITDIESISDDRTEIVVIPFQHKALEEWREYATESGKKTLINRINDFKLPLYMKQGGTIVPASGKGGSTWTCLYEPLQYAVDKVLSPEKVDIIKLMTDGIPDEHEAEYEALLSQWCQIAKEKDAFGFYIMLTSQAVEGRTVLEKINPCRFDAIDVADLGGTDVSLLMLTPPQNVAFNVREDYGKNLAFRLARSGSGTLQQGYKVHVYSIENEYIHVDAIAELQSDCSVTVKADYLMTLEQMVDILPVDFNEKVMLRMEPAEGMDQLPYAMTRILDAPTVMEMINKTEKTVKFHVR